ncbi:MAG: hypothetical protein Q9166_000489 [cf. Caloplaca sp. 2 TL-2023]
MTKPSLTFLALLSYLITTSILVYEVVAEGTDPDCWPTAHVLRPVIFKECLDIINKDLIPPRTDPNIPLKFSKDPKLQPDIMLPKQWTSRTETGNCVIGIDFERHVGGYDRTTLNDVKRAALAIAKKCVIKPPHLGGLVDPVGWQGKMAVMMGGFPPWESRVVNDTLLSE